MYASRLRIAALGAVAATGLSACTTPYGYGGYGPYSGVSVGVSSGYYGSNYGYGYGGRYPGYGYGYGAGYPGYGYGYSPYWGWANNYYYPGTGYYVYDIYRRPHRWTDAQRRYWTDRRQRALSSGTTSQPVTIRENWNDFRRDRTTVRRDPVQRSIERQSRIERASRPARVERTRVERQERASARAERRSERASRSNGRRGNNRDD